MGGTAGWVLPCSPQGTASPSLYGEYPFSFLVETKTQILLPRTAKQDQSNFASMGYIGGALRHGTQ